MATSDSGRPPLLRGKFLGKTHVESFERARYAFSMYHRIMNALIQTEYRLRKYVERHQYEYLTPKQQQQAEEAAEYLIATARKLQQAARRSRDAST